MIHITSSRPSLNIQTPQQDRLPRKRPLEPRRSVSATIASLMSWSITDESSSLLLPKARRRSSEPRSLPHTEMRKDSVMISPTGSLKEEQNYLYSRNDSACSITEPQQRQNVAIITAGPDTWRYEHELESVHNVTTLNIDSRLPLNKRRTPGLPRRRSSLTELHDANYFLIRVPVIMLDDNSADTVRLESAIRFVAKYAQPHAIVILECVVPVGITRRLLEPLISKNTVRCGFCPRLTNSHTPRDTKFVAGLDDLSPNTARDMYSFYATTSANVIPMGTVEAAEVVALYASGHCIDSLTFASETVEICEKAGVDPDELFDILDWISSFSVTSPS